MGLLTNAAHKTKTITRDRSEGLFLYIDGITEAMDAKGLKYGDERLFTGWRQLVTTAKGITQAAISDVKSFCAGQAQSDDMTVLAIYYL